MEPSISREEFESLRKELSRCESALYATQSLLTEQHQWLDRISDDRFFKLAHLLNRLWRQFRSCPYERKLFFRWLKRNGNQDSRFNYIFKIQQLRDRADEHLQCIHTLPHRGLDSQERLYKRFKTNRDIDFSFQNLVVSQTKGLVSVILPVFNGGGLLDASIQSVIDQYYKNFELIIIDDGSTDDTLERVRCWEKRDSRISVVHQDNQKIPRALNRGFSLAKGEYLTWTSADNVMHPDFLARMVDFLTQHSSIALCYANMRLIDESGAPIHNNKWFPKPNESEVVAFPPAELFMNAHGENLIGAAFMYRRIVKELIGGYDPNLYTVEDFDYWLRINDFFDLCHVDFDDAIYDYRIHNESLTSRAKELHINEVKNALMLLEKRRQNIISSPLFWHIATKTGAAEWEEAATRHGHSLIAFDPNLPMELCVSALFVRISPVEQLKPSYRAYFKLGLSREDFSENFDLSFTIGGYCDDQDRLSVKDWETAFQVAQIYAKAKIAAAASAPLLTSSLDVSVVIYQAENVPAQAVQRSLQAALHQTMQRKRYEILVISECSSPPFSVRPPEGCDIFFRSPLHTPGDAYNLALQHSRGQILLFVPAGAAPSPNSLRILLQDFKNDRYAVLIFAGDRLSSPGYKRHREDFLPDKAALFSCKRDIVLKTGGFPSRLFPDLQTSWKELFSLLRKSGYEVSVDPRIIKSFEEVS